MPTLTVRGLETEVYEDLKALAGIRESSMEAEARDILREGVTRRRRWAQAKLADLSGPPELSDLATPFVRSTDLPRQIEF